MDFLPDIKNAQQNQCQLLDVSSVPVIITVP